MSGFYAFHVPQVNSSKQSKNKIENSSVHCSVYDDHYEIKAFILATMKISTPYTYESKIYEIVHLQNVTFVVCPGQHFIKLP